MHADEVVTSKDLVRQLLALQYPEWKDLAIRAVSSAGTDNALYRLGEDMVVRMPRIHWAAGRAEKECHWLPRLAPHLTLTVPEPIAMGAPGEDYPWTWSIWRWIEGKNATLDRLTEPCEAAGELARFVASLHSIDPSSGPGAGEHNSGRGAPLCTRDAPTRAAIGALGGKVDADAVTRAWERAIQAPPWRDQPVWIHGDLQSGNLLAMDGRLRAVIDFGCLGVGDPACDLIVAWNLFSNDGRQVFRRALAVDDATWERGMGWALSTALIALPCYETTNPVLAGIARYTIGELLADHD